MDIIDLKNRKLIKDFKIALKDLEPLVKDPRFLWRGRELGNFSLRPREVWGNWLVCVILREVHGADITFIDDDKGDGFIFDKETGFIIQTEHVCALNIPEAKNLPSGEQRVINAINLKIAKGIEYAKKKILIVFFDGAREFYRNKIRESIYGRHGFEAIFCVGLLMSDADGYSYSVTQFKDSFGKNSITYRVDINSDFTDWKVTRLL